jgi:hypothetical protein
MVVPGIKINSMTIRASPIIISDMIAIQIIMCRGNSQSYKKEGE